MKNPCKGCRYFDACGDASRTAPCEGREEKQSRDQENRKEVR